MFRSILVAGGMALSSAAFASSSFIPLELVELDAQVRVAVIKKYIELTGAAGDQIYYRDIDSGVGKYSSMAGDFSVVGEIWVSNQRKFTCKTSFLRASRDPATGEVTIIKRHLDQNSQCTEVTARE